MLSLHLRIKFRALFLDLFTFDKTVSLEWLCNLLIERLLGKDWPGRVDLPDLLKEPKVLINERGVLLEVV